MIPAIQVKWPSHEWNQPGFSIYIQQDNAPGHVKGTDEDFLSNLEDLGLSDTIKLVEQPPDSPDLNVLDLGLFAALQTMYYTNCPSNSLQLIEYVQQTYDKFDHHKINRIFLTIQTIYNKVIETNGDNSYKILHMKKEKLQKENKLPCSIQVMEWSMYRCVTYAPNQDIRPN